jgi:hypothetical protein
MFKNSGFPETARGPSILSEPIEKGQSAHRGEAELLSVYVGVAQVVILFTLYSRACAASTDCARCKLVKQNVKQALS